MKLIYVFCLTLSIILFSCSESQKSEIEKRQEGLYVSYGMSTIEYEGCEYIVYKDRSRSQVEMLHKQNCKFCERRN